METQKVVQSSAPVPNTPVNRMIAANNRRALEMLLRIQSQVEANTVLTVTPVKGRNYE